jgi:tetratricopeptide (TPR) repeat protein
MKLLIKIFLLLLIGQLALSQPRNFDQKLRLAQNYEQMQDWENAVKIYEELYQIDSLNVVFFDALLRGYDQLKRYNDAVSIINTQLKWRPRDIGLLSQLGRMYARGGNSAEAINSWEKALNIDSKNLTAYTIVANAMIESRMIEQAIKVYQRGRSAYGDPFIFAADLGYLHSVFMNFTEATKEYLLMLKQSHAQLSFVQSRISSYTGKVAGLSAAIVVVENAQKSDPNNPALLQLLAWLYMEGKQYDKAFIIYKSLDEKTKAAGKEIYNFAERSLRDKAYATAAKAFQEIVSSYPKFFNIVAAKFGYARTIEEAAAEEDTLRLFGELKPFQTTVLTKTIASLEFKPNYNAAIGAYEKVISEFLNTEFAARSLFRIAFINFHIFFNLDKANEALRQIETSYSNHISILIESALLMGNVYTAQGNLEKAVEKLRWLIDFRAAPTDFRDKANYALAETDFFKGDFKEALNRLQSLTKNPASEITNDALLLQVLIQENQENENTLKNFSTGIFFKRQRKFEKAAEIFEAIVKENPKAEIVDESLVNAGDVYSAMHRFEEAISAYDRLIKDFPDNIMSDKSQMKIAAVYQFGLKDNTKAAEAYQKLLEQFPSSIYVSEARRKVRELRGDSL